MIGLSDLVKALAGEEAPEGLVPPVKFSRAVVDSRLAEEGALFIALKGENQDGHDFVGDAFERGAVAAIVEKDVSVNCAKLDVREKPLRWPRHHLELPVCIITEGSLSALQEAAAYWRRQHEVRVIGVTG
ncbi:MAG TPA: hypothetical protein ENG33_00995, partial [Chloroflexi bacterium]|nr:hypothetical protein [Chloroflexota bacterium]